MLLGGESLSRFPTQCVGAHRNRNSLQNPVPLLLQGAPLPFKGQAVNRLRAVPGSKVNFQGEAGPYSNSIMEASVSSREVGPCQTFPMSR